MRQGEETDSGRENKTGNVCCPVNLCIVVGSSMLKLLGSWSSQCTCFSDKNFQYQEQVMELLIKQDSHPILSTFKNKE